MNRRSRRALCFVLLISLGLILAGCDEQPFAGDTGGNGDQLEEGPTQSISLQVAEGPQGQVLALIPMFISGQGPYGFALDTGASATVVDQELVEELGLEVLGPAGPVTGVGGAAEAQIVRVEQWRMGENLELPASEITTLDLPDPDRGFGIQGLLGSDLLSSFGAITVDYDESLLIVRPGAESPTTPTP